MTYMETVFDDGRNSYQADPRVSFHQVEEFQQFDEMGHKVDRYVPFDYIRIEVDKNSTLDRRATEEDKMKFRFQWLQYKGVEQEGRKGTKLSELPGMTLDTIQVLNRHNILFIEELAASPEWKLIQAGGQGFVEWKTRAESFLKARVKELAQSERAMVLDSVNKVEELQAKLAEQTKLIEQLLQQNKTKVNKKEAE